MKPKIIAIIGPTATGKTAKSIEFAKELDGEIISADSRQVYRGMDIGSAKVTAQEMEGIPHHLLDVADPMDEFSVADFQRLGKAAIEDILTRGKIPIIVGGTGYYIDALIFDTQLPDAPPNPELRKELEGKTTEELFEQLQELDPDRAETIDQYNRVRLVRAIEIATALGSVPILEEKECPYNVEWIYLDFPDEKLKERIRTRTMARFDQGMIEEVERLHNEGVTWERLESFGLEYRYIAQFLQKKLSREEMIDELLRATWRFVKRQRTWFKRYLKS